MHVSSDNQLVCTSFDVFEARERIFLWCACGPLTILSFLRYQKALKKLQPVNKLSAGAAQAADESVLRGRWVQAGRMLQLLLNDPRTPRYSVHLVLKMMRDSEEEDISGWAAKLRQQARKAKALKESQVQDRSTDVASGGGAAKSRNASSAIEWNDEIDDVFNWSTFKVDSHTLCERGDPSKVCVHTSKKVSNR